ncbi:MAG: hypothetical protein GXY19_04925 [Phycisphaerae bacterium]|nr:hypothetical protein [Phycisphaerae bacterium]
MRPCSQAQAGVLLSMRLQERPQAGQPLGVKIELPERFEILRTGGTLVDVNRDWRRYPDPHRWRQKAAQKRLNLRADKRLVDVLEMRLEFIDELQIPFGRCRLRTPVQVAQRFTK